MLVITGYDQDGNAVRLTVISPEACARSVRGCAGSSPIRITAGSLTSLVTPRSVSRPATS